MFRPLLISLALGACCAPTPNAAQVQQPPQEVASTASDAQQIPTPNCVPEGGERNDLDEIKCCEGLTFFTEVAMQPDGSCVPADPGPQRGICGRTCGDGTCAKPENACSCPADCPKSTVSDDKDCLSEGKTFSSLGLTGPNVPRCCAGLVPFRRTPPPQDGRCITPPPGPITFTCVAHCGDGTCSAPENACSCVSDCGKP